jgi:AcrR family transcriptional regulator
MESEAIPSSDRRRERSRRTRRRIVEAAYQLFVERGYGVPLVEVAAAAGVSVQNLYVTFHNKQTLVQQTLQLAVLGDDRPVPPHERSWMRHLVEAPSPAKAIQVWVANTLPIYKRVAPLAGMFLAEPDLAEIWAHSELLRIEGFRQVMSLVADKGSFRPGLDVDSAADVMFVLLSPVVYQEFVGARGWDPERWSAWTADALSRLLFTL